MTTIDITMSLTQKIQVSSVEVFQRVLYGNLKSGLWNTMVVAHTVDRMFNEAIGPLQR